METSTQTGQTGQVVRRAAEVYEQFFVPALFAEWSPRLADAVDATNGDTALDVACGTGVLARALAKRVGAPNVTGLDCNDGMLAVARQHAPTIHWQKGVAASLPFDTGAFDIVTCQFGLMFFDQQARALREMWRVLEPGGRLAVAVWAPLEETPGYRAMVRLLSRLFGDQIADELRAPFSLGDKEALDDLFAAADIPGVSISTHVGTARFPSIAEWVRIDVRGWTLADKIDDEQFALLAREAEEALRDFTIADGRVEFPSPAHIATARKPR